MNKMNDYQPDTLMKDFWRKTANFDDVCNGLLFKGQTVINEAVELDSEQATTTEKGSIQRRRDLIKMTKINGKNVIIGIENQQTRDKTMPLRDMEYTSLKYGIRLKDSSNEICPIMTLVIYYGKEKWEQQSELKEIMEIPEELKGYINNWKTIIIDAKEVDSHIFKNKEVRDFFEGLQNLYSWDKDIRTLKGLELTYETALAIGVVTGTQALIDKAEREKGGMINMCQAVDEALQEREMKGIEYGEMKGIQLSIQKMIDKLHISQEEAMDVLDIPLNKRYEYKKICD